MPKSKRAKVYHLTKVTRKPRERKENLIENIRQCIPKYKHCFVLSVDNMRNTHLKDVRHELMDSRLFFGKTKLMAVALGATPSEAQADGIDRLTPYLRGTVGLLFTDRAPGAVTAYFDALAPVDFARAGAVAPRAFAVPSGPLFATGGSVLPEHDVPMAPTLEPELRRLGMPTRLLRGRVVLGDEEGRGDPYTVCRTGDVLDSRQTRLLKLFDVCMSEFRVRVVAHWTAETGEMTVVDGKAAGSYAEEEMDEDT